MTTTSAAALPRAETTPSDGRSAIAPIRELRAHERPLFVAHLIALGSEDRYLRFGNPLSDDAIVAYAATIDFRVDTVFGVFDDALTLAAAGHFAPLRALDDAGGKLGPTAEFGLSVASTARRRGLGTALFLRASAHARNLGIRSLFMHCLTENRPMIRIARKAGMEIQQTRGEADAYLALAPGTLATAIEEGVQRQVALFDYAVKRQLLLARRSFEAVRTAD